MTGPGVHGDAESVAALVARVLRDVPDFPTPGILFKDISPLYANAAFGVVVRAIAERLRTDGTGVDLVAGIEARGFVLAGALAREFGIGTVMVRKAGKLPPPTLRRSYDLEYGSAVIEVPVDVLTGRRVLLVDDVLATGGTMRAAADLITEAGGDVVATAVVLELGFLDGRAALDGVPSPHALLTV